MGDTIDDWRALKKWRAEQRRLFGKPCPGCPKIQPKRTPSILLPAERCRACGYVDPRNEER